MVVLGFSVWTTSIFNTHKKLKKKKPMSERVLMLKIIYFLYFKNILKKN